MLEAAVWEDVRSLLSDPERLRAEYERRLRRENAGGAREARPLAALIKKARCGMSRLIDAFGDGLLERGEFEPRLRAARERLARLEEEERLALGRGEEEESLRLVIGQLEGFARRVKEGLARGGLGDAARGHPGVWSSEWRWARRRCGWSTR